MVHLGGKLLMHTRLEWETDLKAPAFYVPTYQNLLIHQSWDCKIALLYKVLKILCNILYKQILSAINTVGNTWTIF